MSEEKIIKNYYFHDNSKHFEHIENYYESAEHNCKTHADDIEDVDFEVVDEDYEQCGKSYSETKHAPRIEGRVIPAQLMGRHAEKVLSRLREANILDEGYKPKGNMTWWQKGELAYLVAVELCIQNTWQVFGQFWNLDAESLRSGFNKAKDSSKKDDFDKKIMAILK